MSDTTVNVLFQYAHIPVWRLLGLLPSELDTDFARYEIPVKMAEELRVGNYDYKLIRRYGDGFPPMGRFEVWDNEGDCWTPVQEWYSTLDHLDNEVLKRLFLPASEIEKETLRKDLTSLREPR